MRELLLPFLFAELYIHSNHQNLHTFRHTSVFLARQSGADVLSISKRLGHASISITADTYSALFKETDLELVLGLEKLQQEVI